MADAYDYRRNGEACLQYAATCDPPRRVFWLEMAQKWFRLADATSAGVDPMNMIMGVEDPPTLPPLPGDDDESAT